MAKKVIKINKDPERKEHDMTEATVEKKAKREGTRVSCLLPEPTAEQYRRAAKVAGIKTGELLAQTLQRAMDALIAERGEPFPESTGAAGMSTVLASELQQKLAQNDGDVFKQRDLANALGVKPATLSTWRRAGCPHMKLAGGKGTVYYLRTAVLEWLAAHQQ